MSNHYHGPYLINLQIKIIFKNIWHCCLTQETVDSNPASPKSTGWQMEHFLIKHWILLAKKAKVRSKFQARWPKTATLIVTLHATFECPRCAWHFLSCLNFFFFVSITSINLWLPQRPCMKWKGILPVGKSLIFVQLALAAWKDLELFWQLNNVNLEAINILLRFRLRKIFSTLIKSWE